MTPDMSEGDSLQALSASLQPIKWLSYDRLRVAPGHQVLDVGCGSGDDTIPLGRLVGSSGRVVGVDSDAALILEAERRAATAHVDAWVTHRQADLLRLPFEAGEFDASRCERLFQYLEQPELVLGEMMRVTRAGGYIAVLDIDWATLSIDVAAELIAVERRLSGLVVRCRRCNGTSGRQLYRLFRQQPLTHIAVEPFAIRITSYPVARLIAGLDDVEREALAAGLVSADELDAWHGALEQAHAARLFFASVVLVMGIGQKPGPA